MIRALQNTGERMVPEALRSADDYVLLLRQLFAYRVACQRLPANVPVLDVGGGEGYGSRLLAEGGRPVVAVEVDPTTVVHAARQRTSTLCSFVLSGGRELPFSAGAFGAMVSFQVIEHVDNDRLFVSELARVLRPGGVALLTTPNRALRLAPGRRPWNRFHRREYDMDGLRDLLATSFPVVAVLGVDATPAVRQLELARLRRMRRIAALDPLRLSSRLPASVVEGLRRLGYEVFLGRRRRKKSVSWVDRYSLEDFFISATHASTSLDLLAVCSDRG
jgi:SAM-dependent methyltransferase